MTEIEEVVCDVAVTYGNKQTRTIKASPAVRLSVDGGVLVVKSYRLRDGHPPELFDVRGIPLSKCLIKYRATEMAPTQAPAPEVKRGKRIEAEG